MAIKRIPDVLASPDQAKRVLREVAILRRLAHPNVIALLDAFTRPSATGGFLRFSYGCTRYVLKERQKERGTELTLRMQSQPSATGAASALG